MLGARDLIPYRVSIYVFTAAVTIMSYYGFEFFYETVRHVPGPHFHAVILFLKKTWEDSVPESVRGPNDPIIENFNKIQEVKEWIKTIQPAPQWSLAALF